MTETTVRAGRRTKVFSRFSSSLIQTFDLVVEPLDGSGEVSGTLEVQGSRWLFPKPSVQSSLLMAQQVRKGYWDTRYAIYVTVDRDARVRVSRARGRATR